MQTSSARRQAKLLNLATGESHSARLASSRIRYLAAAASGRGAIHAVKPGQPQFCCCVIAAAVFKPFRRKGNRCKLCQSPDRFRTPGPHLVDVFGEPVHFLRARHDDAGGSGHHHRPGRTQSLTAASTKPVACNQSPNYVAARQGKARRFIPPPRARFSPQAPPPAPGPAFSI